MINELNLVGNCIALRVHEGKFVRTKLVVKVYAFQGDSSWSLIQIPFQQDVKI